LNIPNKTYSFTPNNKSNPKYLRLPYVIFNDIDLIVPVGARNLHFLQVLTSRRLMRYRTKINSKVGYCQCGSEIWIEYLPRGNKWTFRFSDLNHQEITECPDCGIELKEDDLESM